MNFTEITSGLQFPEGPISQPDGSVLVVEIKRGTLTRVAPDGATSVIADIGGGPNGAAIGPDGACYICNNGGFSWHEEPGILRPTTQADDYSGGRIEKVNLKTGSVELLYSHVDGRRLSAPNDIVFDKTGGFWFTDRGQFRPREYDRGGVCYAMADGSRIEEVIFPLMTPNGIALSPDERTLYVAETQTGRVWSFDVTAPGKIDKQKWPSPNGGTLLAGLPGYQMLDSMKVDSDGNVCVATLANGGITVISPDGSSLEHIALPDPSTTNVCFGGPDLQTIYVTLGSTGRLMAGRWPRRGHPLNYNAYQ